MVIEINKKHIITGITCIIVGIAIGVGGVFLFQNANEAPKEDKPLVTYGVKQEADLSTTLTDQKSLDSSLYQNNRYGFSVRYPSTWITGQPSVNGDGIVISPQDGTIEMSVFGYNNTMNKTVNNEFYSALTEAKDRGIPGFHMISDNWYVVTYTDGTFIYYVKGFVGKRSINTMRIKYLQSMKDQYHDVIQQLEGSFNHGNLEISH
ncbi:hypothetical protein [Veillonella parvula]|jgi:hypothetical protein|uniref:hypothetical protein n=1 Tax=Veillonella parvula TaxID=29466 RepID=UPI0022E57CF3|nr:hypothetical protein [Veillonella parvula]